MEKIYSKTTWVNDSAPDIDADNLNNIENGIDELDNRVVENVNFDSYKNVSYGVDIENHVIVKELSLDSDVSVKDAIKDVSNDIGKVVDCSNIIFQELHDNDKQINSALTVQVNIGSLVENSYVETNGTISAYNGWSRTDYVDISNVSSFYLKTIGSIYNCFYDANKKFISSFDTRDNAIIEVPVSAKYMIISNATNKMNLDIVAFKYATQTNFNKLNETLNVLGKCKNLVQPTLVSGTKNGITYTSNGDGTYTLNGTCTANTWLAIAENVPFDKVGKSFVYQCVNDISKVNNSYIQYKNSSLTVIGSDIAQGTVHTVPSGTQYVTCVVAIYKDKVLSNVLIKPLLTENTSATYDDFVPYTGSGETLTHDVANINNSLNDLSYGDTHGGKNVLDEKWEFGSISVTGQPETSTKMLRTPDFREIKPNTDYTLYNATSYSSSIYWYDSNKNFISYAIFDTSNKTRRSPSNAKYMKYLLWEAYGKTYNHDVCILEGTDSYYEPYIMSNKQLTSVNDSLDVLGKCKNLLNPTLTTTTQNGVTFTANGDGTYTLNGTASADIYKELVTQAGFIVGKTYKLLGCPSGGNYNSYFLYNANQAENNIDYGNGAIYSAQQTTAKINIKITKNTVCNNLVFKPMITTNLNATYDDFVPYTGDGETLTHDVGSIKADLSSLIQELKNKGVIS